MWQELIDTIGNAFIGLGNILTKAMGSIFSYIHDTALGMLLDFVWGIFRFIYHAAKSIYYLIVNLFSSVTGSVTYYLNDIFSGLGVFLGGSTSVFISLFQLVLILIVFSFVVRVILGKLHYFNKKK